MIRIFFTYKHVEAPWGGANNFIRALCADLKRSGCFRFAASPEEACDIIFMNQLGAGPGGGGKLYTLAEVQRWKDMGRHLVVRAVNLNRHAFRLGLRNRTLGWWRDRQTIALLNLADVAVFQSGYQREFFRQAGYRGKCSQVIHNGASPEFWIKQPMVPVSNGALRLVSSTASPRATKRHDLIASLSMHEGVEVRHLGAWPEGLPTGRARLFGMLPRDAMISVLADCHYFLHTAIKDPCPNAIFEAVCAGLPVVYNPGPGSSAEIVGQCGFPLDESDLASTVAQAHRRIDELRAIVLEQREPFAIGHAAARYRKVFEELAANRLLPKSALTGETLQS